MKPESTKSSAPPSSHHWFVELFYSIGRYLGKLVSAVKPTVNLPRGSHRPRKRLSDYNITLADDHQPLHKYFVSLQKGARKAFNHSLPRRLSPDLNSLKRCNQEQIYSLLYLDSKAGARLLFSLLKQDPEGLGQLLSGVPRDQFFQLLKEWQRLDTERSREECTLMARMVASGFPNGAIQTKTFTSVDDKEETYTVQHSSVDLALGMVGPLSEEQTYSILSEMSRQGKLAFWDLYSIPIADVQRDLLSNMALDKDFLTEQVNKARKTLQGLPSEKVLTENWNSGNPDEDQIHKLGHCCFIAHLKEAGADNPAFQQAVAELDTLITDYLPEYQKRSPQELSIQDEAFHRVLSRARTQDINDLLSTDSLQERQARMKKLGWAPLSPSDLNPDSDAQVKDFLWQRYSGNLDHPAN